MNKKNMVQYISLGGVLTSITVMLQGAPILLPAVGLIISPLSTLPIAIAAIGNTGLGISVLLSATLVLFLVSPQEAMILLFTTGFLGIVLGTMLYIRKILITVLTSAIALTVGILALTYIVGVPAFQELAGLWSVPLILFLYFVFSLVYAGIWCLFIRRITYIIVKVMH